jgi:hypothetical protein
MEINVIIAGVLLFFLGLIHLGFPRYFKWKNDLKDLGLLNRQLMYVHTHFIGLMVFLMGLLCISSAKELSGTTLGRKICLGLAIFWLVRLFVQFFGYSSKLWKGKRFETGMHVLFSLLWTYFVITFAMAGF